MKRVLSLLLILSVLVLFSSCTANDSVSKNPTISNISATQKNLYTENGVSVDKDAFPENTVIKIEKLNNDESTIDTLKDTIDNLAVIEAYNLAAVAENSTVQPNGTVDVYFPIPNGYQSSQNDVSVYSCPESGTAQKVESNIESIGIKASVTTLTTFAVVLTNKNTVGSGNNMCSSSSGTGSGDTQGNSSGGGSNTQPTPTDIKGKEYHIYKLGDNNCCYSITLSIDTNYDNVLNFNVGIGDDFDIFYEGSGGEISKEEMLEEYKDSYFKYQNKYYYVGRGDSASYPIISYDDGKITVSLEEYEGNTGTISYTLDGDDLIINSVTDDSEYPILKEHLKTGDKLIIVK